MTAEIMKSLPDKEINNVEEKLQNSLFAKKLPVHIRNIDLDDILYCVNILRIAYFFPTFVIIQLSVFGYINLVFIGIFFFDTFIYLFGNHELYQLCYLTFLVKNTLLIVNNLKLMWTLPQILSRLSIIGFIVTTVSLDASFLYYIGITLKNLENNSKGVKQEQEVEKTI